MAEETVHEVGYINDEHRHALISVHNPSLLNANDQFVQIALSIDSAITLRDNLNSFLARHCGG